MIVDGHYPILSILRQQEKKVDAQQEAGLILQWIKDLLGEDYKLILRKITAVVSDNCASAHVTRTTLIEKMNSEDPTTERSAIKCSGDWFKYFYRNDPFAVTL